MYNIQMKNIRKKKGITLAKLSEMTNISIGYLCHLENGTRKNPSIEIMDRIAISLGSSINDIFFQ